MTEVILKMNFQEAEKTFKDLRAQHSAGKLSSADFEAEVAKLRIQDAQGRWWQIGVQTGAWYVHDGQKWSKARPPIAVPPTVLPTIPPEESQTQRPAHPSVLPPRLFSATPPGRGEGGLPVQVLAGIIIVVALVGALTIFGGYLLLSGQLNLFGSSTARTTTTPTVSVVVLPTSAPPTLAPPRATSTPIPLPTIVVTPTAAVTPTKPPVPSTPKPTATPKPPTPAASTPTRTLVVAPGVYVTKLRTDPAQPNFWQEITFYVTFYNNAGVFERQWLVKLFKCDAACTADELSRSIGETPKSNKVIVPGTPELGVGPWSVGLGACNYVASPYYVDQSGNPVPFYKTDGSQLYQTINLCH